MDFFKTVNHLHSLQASDNKAIAVAHEKFDYPKGSLLLETGKLPVNFVIEKGLCRTFLYDYNRKKVIIEFYYPKDLMIESFRFAPAWPTAIRYKSMIFLHLAGT